MKKLIALSRGELPLGEAFWTWTVLGGLLVNISTSIAFLVLIIADLPWLALFLGYGLSVPYNILVLVGVWKSAAHFDGPTAHANLARGASLVLMVVLSLT